jgi:hypothetical protein
LQIRVVSIVETRVRGRAERRILEALREGRREAYEDVIDAHYASIYRLLLFLTRDATAAEDMTQEVFASAWAPRGLPGRCLGQDVVAPDCVQSVSDACCRGAGRIVTGKVGEKKRVWRLTPGQTDGRAPGRMYRAMEVWRTGNEQSSCCTIWMA